MFKYGILKKKRKKRNKTRNEKEKENADRGVIIRRMIRNNYSDDRNYIRQNYVRERI